MSWTNTTEDNILALIFTATAWANIADNAASSPATNIYISLHTADPGESASQTTSEANYTGYGRVPIGRTTTGWTVSSGACDNDAAITFGQCTAGSSTCTYLGAGLSSSGTGTMLITGALTASLAVSNGITPEFAQGDCNFTQD